MYGGESNNTLNYTVRQYYAT